METYLPLISIVVSVIVIFIQTRQSSKLARLQSRLNTAAFIEQEEYKKRVEVMRELNRMIADADLWYREAVKLWEKGILTITDLEEFMNSAGGATMALDYMLETNAAFIDEDIFQDVKNFIEKLERVDELLENELQVQEGQIQPMKIAYAVQASKTLFDEAAPLRRKITNRLRELLQGLDRMSAADLTNSK